MSFWPEGAGAETGGGRSRPWAVHMLALLLHLLATTTSLAPIQAEAPSHLPGLSLPTLLTSTQERSRETTSHHLGRTQPCCPRACSRPRPPPGQHSSTPQRGEVGVYTWITGMIAIPTCTQKATSIQAGAQAPMRSHVHRRGRLHKAPRLQSMGPCQMLMSGFNR